jgi:hypothetical protein
MAASFGRELPDLDKPVIPAPPTLTMPTENPWQDACDRYEEKHGKRGEFSIISPNELCGSPDLDKYFIRVDGELRGAVEHCFYRGTLRFDIELHPHLRGIGMYRACLDHVISMYEEAGSRVSHIPALMDHGVTQQRFFSDLNRSISTFSDTDLAALGLEKMKSSPQNSWKLRSSIIEAARNQSIAVVRRKCGFGDLQAITVVPDRSNATSPNHGVFFEFNRGEERGESEMVVRMLLQTPSAPSHNEGSPHYDTSKSLEAQRPEQGQNLSEIGRVRGQPKIYPKLPEGSTIVDLKNDGSVNVISQSQSQSHTILGDYGAIPAGALQGWIIKILAGDR